MEFPATYEMPRPNAHAIRIMSAAISGDPVERSRPDYTHGPMQLRWDRVNVFELQTPVWMLNNPAHFRIGGEHESNYKGCVVRHKSSGGIYHVTDIANLDCIDKDKFPAMVIYVSHAEAKVYARKYDDFIEKFERVVNE